MAITIVTTIAGASSNSYVAVDDANTYFESRLDAETWNTAGEERQAQALLTAMRVLESLDYIGARSTGTQALSWPRVATTQGERGYSFYHSLTSLTLLSVGEGLYDNDGRKWLVTAIPTPLKNAQCEIALAMLTDQTWVDADTVPEAEFSAGSVRIKSGDSKRGKIPAAVGTLLAGLLKSGVQLMRA